MAILNSIRKRGIFLIVIIAMALFAFIFSSLVTGGGLSSEKAQSTVATVNGIDMPRLAFMEEVERYKSQVGPNVSPIQAMNVVWDRELSKVLLKEQFEALDLRVEEEQLNYDLSISLATDPTFIDANGNFSLGRLNEYVASIRSNPTALSNWNAYIESRKMAILENTYMNMIQGGMSSTLADGEQEYRYENDKVNMEFVYVPYTSISDDDISVSDEEIGSYIKLHPKEFEVEPQVDIQYVSFNEEPSEIDIEASRLELIGLLNDRTELNPNTNVIDTIAGFVNTTDYEEFVNANSDVSFLDRWWLRTNLPPSIKDTMFNVDLGGIYGPYKVANSYSLTKVIDIAQKYDSVNSKHILIRYAGSLRNPTGNTGRTKEDAQKLADSLLTSINSDKSKFEQTAIDFSEDSTNSAKGGELGYYGPGAMVKDFDEFIFDNSVGTIGMVETDFGFHIIKIEDQKNMQKVIKVATITKEIEPSEETINQVFAEATSFELASQEGDFTSLATEQEIPLKPVNKIGELDAIIPGIGSNRGIVSWAFTEESNVGDIKRFNVSTGYVIAQLTRKTPKGLLSVAESSTRVIPILRNEKKAAQIISSTTGSTLDEAATSSNTTVQSATAITMANPIIPGSGVEPKAIGAAFGTPIGEVTDLIEGNSGVYKIRVLSFNKAPDLDNYTPFVNQLNSKLTPTIRVNVNAALKNAADIEDHRAAIY
jgi:peptidyl-prolyl cis-trans isomerase D